MTELVSQFGFPIALALMLLGYVYTLHKMQRGDALEREVQAKEREGQLRDEIVGLGKEFRNTLVDTLERNTRAMNAHSQSDSELRRTLRTMPCLATIEIPTDHITTEEARARRAGDYV